MSLKSFFHFKKKDKHVEPNRIKDEINFTDLNKTPVNIMVKHVDGKNLLIITINGTDDYIVLDQESAVVLQAIISDFIKTGNLKNVSKVIGE